MIDDALGWLKGCYRHVRQGIEGVAGWFGVRDLHTYFGVICAWYGGELLISGLGYILAASVLIYLGVLHRAPNT